MTDAIEKPQMPEQITRKSEEIAQEAGVPLNIQVAKLQRERDELKSLLEEYNKTFNAKVDELKHMMDEADTLKGHLAAMEMAFSDLVQKYERCKTIVQGYKQNEDTLREHVQMLEETLQKNEEKYEALKAHAKSQLERASHEIRSTRMSHEAEVAKYNALIKRLEIKHESTVQALDQKTKECSSMAALFDEMTGKM